MTCTRRPCVPIGHPYDTPNRAIPPTTKRGFLVGGLKVPCVFVKVAAEVPLKVQRSGPCVSIQWRDENACHVERNGSHKQQQSLRRWHTATSAAVGFSYIEQFSPKVRTSPTRGLRLAAAPDQKLAVGAWLAGIDRPVSTSRLVAGRGSMLARHIEPISSRHRRAGWLAGWLSGWL